MTYDKQLPPTVLTMVRDRLIEDGYDGLCHEDCACDLDGLARCGNIYEHCCAGFKVPCTCGDGCDFHIVPEKPA
jgi:hypothetical protein